MPGTPLKKTIFLLRALLTVFALISKSQTATVATSHPSPTAEESRTFFPHNWVRGYTDFEVAPSHNEPDLGRCALPPSSRTTPTGTAYARYLLGGYHEFHHFGLTAARHIFLFFQRELSFGRNSPQHLYTA